MNPRSKFLFSFAVIAVIATGLIACNHSSTKISESESSATGTVTVTNPSPTSGTLIPLVSQFATGSGTCFPSANGWDRFFIIGTNFLGPNTKAKANCYTNEQNFTKVTVETCDAANGSTLETGINIQQVPGTAQCATNTPGCAESSKLTINTRAMESGKTYRATIHYKSSTATGLTNILVKWHYHNN